MREEKECKPAIMFKNNNIKVFFNGNLINTKYIYLKGYLDVLVDVIDNIVYIETEEYKYQK